MSGAESSGPSEGRCLGARSHRGGYDEDVHFGIACHQPSGWVFAS